MKQLIPQIFKNYFHAASAFLANVWYRFPSRNLTIIGVTGTDGKTTTSSLIYHLLKHSNKKAALISTVAAYIGHKTINTGFHTTTPNEWALQKLLATIRAQGITYVVLESTSIGLDQHRLLGINFKVAVYTNITHEHLDYHGQLSSYIHAKARLAKHSTIIVYNHQDPNLFSLVSQFPHKQVLGYNLDQLSEYPWIKTKFSAPFNQLNALAAITCVKALNIKVDTPAAIKSFTGVSGRLESIPNQRGLHIYVDFAHTPNAIKAILSHLKAKHPHSRLICLFGATGKRDSSKRPAMGQYASALSDEVILTSDDCYGEDVNRIIAQIKSGIATNHGHIHSLPDRFQALAFALKLATSGDVIAVLGQGHEQTLNLDGHKEISWSDQAIIKSQLSGSTQNPLRQYFPHHKV